MCLLPCRYLTSRLRQMFFEISNMHVMVIVIFSNVLGWPNITITLTIYDFTSTVEVALLGPSNSNVGSLLPITTPRSKKLALNPPT